jgi:four helix bundle protein
MARDPRKLRVFTLADELLIEVYRATAGFPSDERHGLRGQLRRAAVSTASNIVEGCARRTTRDYVHFMNMATGSAAEAAYLLDVAERLGLIDGSIRAALGSRYSELLGGLQKLTATLSRQDGR